MPSSPYRPISHRGDFRWLLLVLGIVAYLLVLVWERVEHRERSSRIESLESTLQQKRTDEALRLVELERVTGYLAVQDIAQERGMSVASVNQCFLLATEVQPATAELGISPFQAVSQWVTRTLRGGIAQARPSASEGGDAEGSR
jgi:hypothetical protein